MTALRARAAAVLLGLAAAAVADDAVPPPVPVRTIPSPGPAAEDRDVRVFATRWQARPWIGATTLRLSGLERFPDAAGAKLQNNWALIYGAKEDSTDRTPLDLGLVTGFDASFRLDPLVSVAVRIGRLESARGGRVTKSSAGATKFRDEWEVDTSMLLVMGGAGFHLPLGARTRMNVSLFLGTGLARVRIAHRVRIDFASGSALDEGAVEADGTSFVPEFAFEIEHDLADALAVGAALGYRFGGIETFTTRTATSVNQFSGTPEADEGWPLRDADRALLTGDYGGLVLALYLAARI